MMLKLSLVILLMQTGALLAMAAVIDRTKPPQTPPLEDYKLPPVYETKLANGLGVMLVEDARFPLVTVRLGFLAGSRFDPKDRPGQSENVAALLIEGTKTRTSRQIAEELATIGGSLGGVSGADGLTLAGSVLSENTPRLLEILADVARNASFPADEVELQKQNRRQALMAQMSQPDFLAQQRMMRVLMGEGPYAHIAPTMQSLEKLTPEELVRFRDTYLAPNNATLILVGRIPPRAETMKLIEKHLGPWQRREVAAAARITTPSVERQIVLVDRPGSVQADIRLGRIGLTRGDPDYIPLVVANTILGGGVSSRLFTNVREKHGYAYDVHSMLDPKKDLGVFETVTEVRNEVLEPALKAVLADMEGLVKEPVTQAELDNAKNFQSGMFVMRLQTQAGVADQLNMLKLMGLPNEYLEKFTARIRAVTAEQVQAAARKYMAPDKAAVIVVGDASKIGAALGTFGKVEAAKVEP